MKFFLAGILIFLGATAAQAAPPLVNPVTVGIGATVHLTPIDQTNAPIPIGFCTVVNVLPAMATITYDATGANITGIAAGSAPNAMWHCVNGATTVNSLQFTLTVPAPWSVTAVGDTLP